VSKNTHLRIDDHFEESSDASTPVAGRFACCVAALADFGHCTAIYAL
jgi:hypothetical protein